tara:strand:+ start:172 stop:372 length:201 start_codon:yes stop_codon:yes gene_type:complete
MKKYEYVTVDPDEQIGISKGMNEDEILNTLGKCGWELMQVFSEPQDGLQSYKIKHYYRREIQQYQF